MAGGPIGWTSAVPVSSNVFPNIHVGAGANSKHDDGHGWAASLAADAIWRFRFPLPPAWPTGTLKLKAKCLANATSGSAKLNPKFAAVAAGEDPSSATLTAVGVQTLTWATGDNDKYKQFSVTLTGPSSSDVGKTLAVDLVGETSGWTLAQVLTVCEVVLVWE